MNESSFGQIEVSKCETHHISEQVPLYSKRFKKVLKYHEPGLAPVISEDGAFHIDLNAQAVYPQRFQQVFGFYQMRAAVKDTDSWFHILPDGSALYSERYAWCGNFQNNACVIKDFANQFFHIGLKGERLYQHNYAYAGDFRDNIAVVQNEQGKHTHIRKDGSLLHGIWFKDLDIYHKGYARALDEQGWFHINYDGKALYEDRYSTVEPFYNGMARVTTFTNAILRIDEQGKIFDILADPTVTEFQQLSSDLVGFWKTQTIYTAVELQVFEYLPSTKYELAEAIGISIPNTLRLLRGLQELKLVNRKGDSFLPTSRAEFLKANHPMSLCQAAKHWAQEHYWVWKFLTKSLQNNIAEYSAQYDKPLFEWLDQDQAKLEVYHHAMASYAKHDYEKLSSYIDLRNCKSIIDAGGGTGTLLSHVLGCNPGLSGILLERKSVTSLATIPEHLANRMKVNDFDLFSPWPEQAEVVILSRVLHDWNDEQCKVILQHAYNSIEDNGRLIIVEFLLNDNGDGGMLDLNMLVVTGGKERSLDEFQELADETGFIYVGKQTCGSYNILNFLKT